MIDKPKESLYVIFFCYSTSYQIGLLDNIVLIIELLVEKKSKKSWLELVTSVVMLLSCRMLAMMLWLICFRRPESIMQCFVILR